MKELCLRCELFADDLNFTLNGTCILLIELQHPLLMFNTSITVKILLNAQEFIKKKELYNRKGWAFIRGYAVGHHSRIHI